MVTGTEVEIQELKTYIDNDADLYIHQGLPIVKNLTRKKAAGVYDHNKAAKLYKYLADNGARKYGREHGSSEHEGLRIFSPEVRRRVAEQMRDQFEQGYDVGEYYEYIPKKYKKASERMEKL